MTKSWRPTLFLVMLCMCLCQTHIALAQLRIVGGETTTIGAAPYVVNLAYEGSFFCGGSLIRRQYVLTAAHCVKGKNVKDIVVTAGSSTLDGTGIKRRVIEKHISSNYSTTLPTWDVAVLKLASPIEDTRVQPIGLCDSILRVGDSVTIFGWGLTNEDNNIPSNQLRKVTVPIVNKDLCKQDYRSVMQLTNTMFCAAVNGLKDSCSGDSGGPAVFGGRVCGIVSFGAGCARRGYPGVYTSVRKVKSFILKHIQ